MRHLWHIGLFACFLGQVFGNKNTLARTGERLANPYVLQITVGTECPHPSSPINTLVSSVTRNSGDSAKYSCDEGYTLFGNPTVTCNSEGKWTGDIPHCATNVAWKKPVNQSSTSRGGNGENANDGDRTTMHEGRRCTETLTESSPWWAVDLLQEYEITVVRVTARGCCGHKLLQDIEVRVGDSTNIQRNRLCAWHPGVIDEGSTKELFCARPMLGRYVFVQMVGVEGSMSLCEVEVFSTQEFSRERCKEKTLLQSLGIYNQTCYEFQISNGGTFDEARQKCQAEGGDLVQSIQRSTNSFLTSELERLKDSMKTQMVWIGSQREPQFISRTWRWVDGGIVDNPRWGKDQPNNYNGKQNCVVLDGGRDWLWNDVGCDLNYLHWICQFQPTSCGTPDRRENTTISDDPHVRGSSVTYRCPRGNMIVGDSKRTCLESGFWSGEAPQCRYVDCGHPPSIEDGILQLIDQRTNFEARVTYQCSENFTLVGNATAVCSPPNVWVPAAPKCLFSWCPEISSPSNGIIKLEGKRAGHRAHFRCQDGYKLLGGKTLTCNLGGKWSAELPVCSFVDCGSPESIQNGVISLVNGTTHMKSLASYECDEDHWLDGDKERVCQDNGLWSGLAPVCALTNCGEPEVPLGAFVTGYNFDVHSQVTYHCEVGHFMTGSDVRVCGKSGQWSGQAPTCTYIDCGPLPNLPRGEILYVNESTHLGSLATLSCVTNHKLIGPSRRKCLQSGQWDASMPSCEEIRCLEPDPIDRTKTSITGNERRTISTRISKEPSLEGTYKIGSTATYRCDRGFAVIGEAVRTCEATGAWSEPAPSCKFVDCGLPEAPNPGIFRLLSNETSYSAAVAYECPENWKLEGKVRRFCQENATWSGDKPRCLEITCPDLMAELSKALTVEHETRQVGTSATYKCPEGKLLVGEAKRQCQTHGIWSGTQPYCEWVTCTAPEEVENGRVLRLNETLLFDTMVEYHCFPKFKLHGSFVRKCNSSGQWSGEVPKCLLESIDIGILADNTVDGTTNSARGGTLDAASNTGLYVGLGVGLIAVVCVAVIVALFKTRQPKTVDNSYPRNSKSKFREERTNHFGDINAESNIYENIADDITEMSSTSSSPTYSNGVANGGPPPLHIMQRPRMPPPQPPNPPAFVTINSVAVNTTRT